METCNWVALAILTDWIEKFKRWGQPEINLKTILKKISLGEEIFTKFMQKNEIENIKDDIENIKFYRTKNKKPYLIHDLYDHSEIAFIIKKQ